MKYLKYLYASWNAINLKLYNEKDLPIEKDLSICVEQLNTYNKFSDILHAKKNFGERLEDPIISRKISVSADIMIGMASKFGRNYY